MFTGKGNISLVQNRTLKTLDGLNILNCLHKSIQILKGNDG